MQINDIKQSCPHCNHMISCIHYDGNQYYHDSFSKLFTGLCGNTNVTIPCSLIKQNWKEYSKNQSRTERFCIKKCLFTKTDLVKNSLYRESVYEDMLCYDIFDFVLKAYVKKQL